MKSPCPRAAKPAESELNAYFCTLGKKIRERSEELRKTAEMNFNQTSEHSEQRLKMFYPKKLLPRGNLEQVERILLGKIHEKFDEKWYKPNEANQ